MRKRFHWLKKPKVRQDWSKENLYNLSRVTQPYNYNSTYFQQKWASKSATRAYHGEQIREKQWERMFSRRLPSVQPMNVTSMAMSDGSEFAAGRGSGEDGMEAPSTRATPYMQMVYHPMERRLDVAIFRALFASSTRQARQFVVHGFVKVNGKKMQYPGYLLNPGDMFQVEPERVLWATGARKDQHRYGPAPPEVHPTLGSRRRDQEEGTASSRQKTQENVEEDVENDIEGIARTEDAAEDATEQIESPEAEAISSEDDSQTAAEEGSSKDGEALTEQNDAGNPTQTIKDQLMTLRDEVKASMEEDEMSNKRKRELRDLRTDVRKALSNFKKTSAGDLLTLKTRLSAIQQLLPSAKVAHDKKEAAETHAAAIRAAADKEEKKLVNERLKELLENPPDPSKPYLTPWRPRDYMSAFAFIPRYLEVNQKICSAVYLRHPVARPGMSEVPTPFDLNTSQLAFNWYLRRR